MRLGYSNGTKLGAIVSVTGSPALTANRERCGRTICGTKVLIAGKCGRSLFTLFTLGLYYSAFVYDKYLGGWMPVIYKRFQVLPAVPGPNLTYGERD